MMSDRKAVLPRFSILWLLTLMLLACISESHYRVSQHNLQQSVEICDLTQSVKEFRDELGHIEVTDPTKAYVRQLACSEPFTWKYRVFLPANKPFGIRIAPEWSKDGMPGSGSGGGPIHHDRQFTMTVNVSMRPDGRRFTNVATPRFTSNSMIPANRTSWITSMKTIHGTSHLGAAIQHDADSIVPIVTYRAQEHSFSDTPPTDSTDGITVWLEPMAPIVVAKPKAAPFGTN